MGPPWPRCKKSLATECSARARKLGPLLGAERKSNKTKLLSPTHNNRSHSLDLPVRLVRANLPERLRRRKDQGRWGQRPSPLGGMLSSASHYFSSRRAYEQFLLLRRKRGRRPLPFQTPISLIQWQWGRGEGERSSQLNCSGLRLKSQRSFIPMLTEQS
jgi:hypothetical protein